LVIKTLDLELDPDPDPHWDLDPQLEKNTGSGSALNQCGFTILAVKADFLLIHNPRLWISSVDSDKKKDPNWI
jgi:hypothetical protein